MMQKAVFHSPHPPESGDDEGGEEVRDADVRQAEEVRPDGKDEDVADAAEPGEGAVRHVGSEQSREGKDRALKEPNGDGGEDAALAEGRREKHDDDAVEDALCKEDGRVAEQAVVDRSDDRHGADADRERGGDEAVDKPRIARAARDALQPRAERGHARLDVQQLADETADDEARDYHVDAAERELPVRIGAEHRAQRAAEPEEHHGERTGAHQGLLHALRDKAAAAEPQDAPERDGGDVGDDSDAGEHGAPPFPIVVMVYCTPFRGGCKMKESLIT